MQIYYFSDIYPNYFAKKLKNFIFFNIRYNNDII